MTLAGDWHGTIGVVRTGYHVGPDEELVRLLPAGIGFIYAYAGLNEFTGGRTGDALAEGFRQARESYHQRGAELAKTGLCDFIHTQGAPPFMVAGYGGEQAILRDWEEEYKAPVFTSAITEIEALRAVGAQRFLGFTFYDSPMPEIFTRYFVEGGLDVADMVTLPPRPHSADWPSASSEDIYRHIRRAFFKHTGVQGIYLHGAMAWGRTMYIVPLIEELGVPVVHPVVARAWYIK